MITLSPPPSLRRLFVAAGLLLAIIILPFLWIGPDMEFRASIALATREPHKFGVAAFNLLSADILLPIPSSVVATASGAVLGPWIGTLVSAGGLSVGAVAIFTFVRLVGVSAARKLIGDTRYEEFAAYSERRGPWLIALLRPVPVLSEASVIAFAALRAPWLPSIVAILLSSTLVGALYAILGAVAQRNSSEFLLLAAAMLPPAVAWLIARRLTRA